MKRAKKEQIENFIKLLEQAHDRIEKIIMKNDFSKSLGLLEDCQTGAIALGKMIEQSEGEDFPTITLLEQYCEIAYRIYESIEQNRAVSVKKTYKLLNQLLIQISNSVKNDIIIRKEVVFLPYKAAMWDSLESVWKAMDSDSKCDAYVIPIPYFNKNPDGSFREKNYEAHLMPDYVPITSYEEYDFDKRRPDEIYIHNPYDECNCVTSVHPFFYSKNLRKYTDKLIYIPYFVLDEIMPDDKAGVESMEHFAQVPAIINSDIVMVQSENIKQCYVQSLVKLAGENTREIWDKKIIGSGSPKYDKVQNTTKDNLKIPEEWKKLMIKPGGGNKKVILYNTSIGAFLEYNERMIKKIQRVFEIYKENISDVVLLWRPHPLIQATIKSMRPQLWTDYEKIVNQYKEEGWGIYDDSADMNRAIALSDAYYGDRSSLVQLCQKVEKPVMIQNIEIVDNV